MCAAQHLQGLRGARAVRRNRCSGGGGRQGRQEAPAAKKAPPPKEDKKAAAKKGGAEPAGAPAEADVAGLQRLAAALARLPRLRMLDLGDNRLGPAGARLHSSSDEKRIVA